MWDTHVGRCMPDADRFVGSSVEVWSTLSSDLVQSFWSRGTRAQYQGWLSGFLTFCAWCAVPALPLDPFVFTQWITRVATQYAYSTVQIAASAVIGFCLMNNFQHPLKQHGMCRLAVDAVRRVKCGSTKALRAALDAHFVIDIWHAVARLRARGDLSIVNRRARCFTQLAFEGALRGDEICNLKICDVVFCDCGPRCGLACVSHDGVDAYVFVRIHKTSRGGKVKVVRLVVPETATIVDGESVSAAACLASDWLPFLREHGIRRNSSCQTSYSTRFRCDVCPELFPTFPSAPRECSRAIDVSAVTRAYKKFALLTLRSPIGYSSHSGRIGSYSGATENDDCDAHTAASQLGWASARVPQRVYKRKTQSEARKSGLALAERIKAAAGPAHTSSVHGSTACTLFAHAQENPKTPSVPTISTARPQKAALPKIELTPTETSVVAISSVKCACCQTMHPGRPSESAGAQFCRSCWESRRERCRQLLNATESQLARWQRLCSFPLSKNVVEGKVVCVGYQLGMCRDPFCPEAHVCHGCGREHTNGSICSGARRVASKWQGIVVKKPGV